MFAYWKRPDDAAAGRPDWIAVALFFLFACAWSWAAARWGGVVRLPGGSAAPVVDGSILVGFGPVMGALVADLVRPMKRAGRVGFLGRSRILALAALFVPALCLATGGMAKFNVDAHLDGLTMGLSLAVYCIGEELGWREWLHNALAGLPLWNAVLVTWALWFGWHWTFFWPTLIVPTAGIIFALLLLAAAFGLAATVRRTRSSAFAAGWHAAARALGSPAQIVMILLLALATWLAGERTPQRPWSAWFRSPRRPF